MNDGVGGSPGPSPELDWLERACYDSRPARNNSHAKLDSQSGLAKEDVLAANLVTISRVKSCFTGQRGSLYSFLPEWVALGGGMVLLAIGEGMLAPVTVAALRRYTTTAQRSIAFSVFYAAMNAGFYLAVHVSDALRAGLGEHGRFRMPGLGYSLSS